MKRLALLVAVVLCVGALAAPAAAQQTDNGTATETADESATPTPPDMNEETSTPQPIQSPSGSPVSTAAPQTTSGGDGPGFGVVMALVAGLAGAGVAVRRRQA